MTLDARKDRTALRLRLYENGFTPLANKSKMCLIKGWSTLEVTPELIQSKAWARSGSFLDTGIRGGDVIALDWDIDDKKLLNKLLDEVVEQGIVDESVFVRIGKPPRELWVYRTRDKIGKRTTGHFLPPDADPLEHHGFAVEVLGKGCQFAAFGQRDEVNEYKWPVESPLDHVYMDLPVITLAQVEAVVAYSTAFFERNGLTRQSPGGGTDHGYTHVYDLDDEMVFEAKDLGTLSYAELTQILTANPDEVIRVKADPFRPTSGSWAAMASLSGGVLCVSDHGTYTSHFPVEADTQKAVSALGQLLAERAARQPKPAPLPQKREPVFLDPYEPFEASLKKSVEKYVYVTDGNLVVDLDDMQVPMTADTFNNLTRNIYTTEIGKQGGEKIVRLSDQWFQEKTRRTLRTMSMRPDQPYPVFVEAGVDHLNTYEPNILPTTGDAGIGMAFIETLLPVENERRYFLQWLGHKIDHPADRGPGIIMVAHETYGTGRGTLIDLLRCIFGQRYVRNVNFATLSGSTYQSQYNEWMVDSLVVAVDEAQETNASVGRWQARHNAYEKLKEVVDPGNHHVDIIRKGARNTAGRTFASIIVLTNHADAIGLPISDRRFAVLENGQTLSQDQARAVHAWMEDPGNIGAFIAYVRTVDRSSYNPFAAPPLTASKQEMAEASSSEMDRIVNEIMAGFSNTLLCFDQVHLMVEAYLQDNQVEVPDDWTRVANLLFKRKTRKLVEGSDRVRIEGKQRTVRVVGRVASDIVATSENVIVEVLKNGPVSRQIRSTGTVVDFSRR